MNKILLAFFAFAITYSFIAAPPQNIARGIGQLIPLAVLALTIVTAARMSKHLVRITLIANIVVCLIASVVFLFVVSSGVLASGVVMIILFIPFFINAYFLARYKHA